LFVINLLTITLQTPYSQTSSTNTTIWKSSAKQIVRWNKIVRTLV